MNERNERTVETVGADADMALSTAREALEKVDRLDVIGEAMSIVRGILADLIDAASVDTSEYADDLDRLDQLADLAM